MNQTTAIVPAKKRKRKRKEKDNSTQKLTKTLPDSSGKQKSYRLAAKNIFLTYPKCDIEPQNCLHTILDNYQDRLLSAMVCQESHEDGEKHLHALLMFKKRFQTRNQHLFDKLVGQHGSYEACKNVTNSIKYLAKEGNYVTHNLDVEKYLKAALTKKSPKFAIVEHMLDSGKTLEEVKEAMPGFVLQHLNKIRTYIAYNSGMQRPALKWPGVEYPLGTDKAIETILKWIAANLETPRKFKQPQLYIYGPANVGKTTLWMTLSQYFRIYKMPHEDFYDGFQNGKFDLAVLDEFKADKKITWLNEWLEGSMMSIRYKGSQGLKTQNIPTIILSNYSLEECYANIAEHNPGRLDTIRCRLEVVYLTEFIDLKKYLIKDN